MRGAFGLRLAPAAEAEYVSEYIAKVAEIAEAAKAAEARAAAKARAGIKGRMAVLVILRALIVVRQHLVRLVDLLEPLLAGFVARVEIGVVLLGKFAVCFFISSAVAPFCRPSTS